MQKGKIVSMPTSLEGQIRSRARNLPIDKCYINEGWYECGKASIVVLRRHTNGNVTFAVYLVDLYLLGVKECTYSFNVPEAHFRDMLDNTMPLHWEKCDYVLAHNIIYGAVEFAGDYGFAPCKDYTKAGIYILEEDTDDIPVVEIPFGDSDGQPLLFVSPGEDRRREIAILEKSAGPGNYHVVYVGDDENENEDDEYEEELSYREAAERIRKVGIEEYMKHMDYDNLVEVRVMMDTLYLTSNYDQKELHRIDKEQSLIMTDKRVTVLRVYPEVERYVEPMNEMADEDDDDMEKMIVRLEEWMDNDPDNPHLGFIHFFALCEVQRFDQAGEAAENWFRRMPDHFIARLMYAEWLVLQKRYDDALEFFRKRPGLDALTKKNVPINRPVLAEFCACYIRIWMAKDQMRKAEPYYRILCNIYSHSPFVVDAVSIITLKRIEWFEKQKEQKISN